MGVNNGKSVTADLEGWYALTVAILRDVPCDDAFRMLEGNQPRKNKAWTEEEYLEIGRLRAEGWKWEELGNMYGKNPSTVHHAFTRWKEKNK